MSLNLSLESSSPGSPQFAPPPGTWRLRDASWRRVLAQQDYGSVLSTLVVCIALLVTEATLDGPRARPFQTTDATIAFPYNNSTIPYWLAIVASLVAALASILAAELWLARKAHADASDALAAVLHFVIDCLSAFFVTGLATTVVKMVVGRLRPDFLDRCQPKVPSPVTVSYGLPPADNPACTAPPSWELTDGQYSFPSGHTSTVFVFSVWTVGYWIWASSMRVRQSGRDILARGLGERLLHELGTSAGFMWIVVLLAWAWAVGVSRITDFKHHPSDVVAGALLGTLFGAAFVVRAIARLGRVMLLGGAEAASTGGGSCGMADGTPDAGALLLHNTRVHPGSGAAGGVVGV